jgi:hypothetical protein
MEPIKLAVVDGERRVSSRRRPLSIKPKSQKWREIHRMHRTILSL